jgi:hypothetical protein
MRVGGALLILDGDSPVLVERPADTNIVNKHNYDVSHYDVKHKESQCFLIKRQLSTSVELAAAEINSLSPDIPETPQKKPDANLDTPSRCKHTLLKRNDNN